MIIYVSSATSYLIYDREFLAGNISSGQQAQKFNILLIKGLGRLVPIVSIATLPYKRKLQCSKSREEIMEDGIKYICIKNNTTKMFHKIFNLFNTIHEIYQIRRQNESVVIICDSINLSASASSISCKFFFKIPCIAIVTDVPEIMCNHKMGIWMKLDSIFMKQYDAYVLLSPKMNKIVNPHNRPHVIIEGSCENNHFQQTKLNECDDEKKICLFSGTLHKNIGIEVMIKGFLSASVANSELWIYGDGPFVELLKHICARQPSIRYGGIVQNKDIIKVQSQATLLINPRLSTLEYCEYSFPSKLMEYLVSGTAVLTTRFPGIPPEYLKYMYFIDDESERGFSDAIRNVLSKPNKELYAFGDKAKQYVAKNKNNIVQAKKILGLLELTEFQKSKQ